MAGVMTYSPRDVVVLIEGYTLPGLMSVSLAWNVPPYTMVNGIRGKTTRVLNKNTSATLTLECLQTSVVNDVLYQILNKDIVSGQARLNVTLKDNSGSFAIFSNQGYVQSYPEFKFSNQFDNRTWQIGLLQVESVDAGGNSVTAQSLFDQGSEYLSNLL